MILAVAATDFEMSPFLKNVTCSGFDHLVCGVGPVESCLQLTRYLALKGSDISCVVNFGVAGAYILHDDRSPQLLDICLAEAETIGDLGICFPRRIDDLPADLVEKELTLDVELRSSAEDVLTKHNLQFWTGRFVTVSCVSGTTERGELLRKKHTGLCENMEGAALARVCREFALPFLQLRCISNFVENRDTENWKLEEAAEKSAQVAALIIDSLGKTDA